MIFTAPDGTQVTFIDTPDEHITERIGEHEIIIHENEDGSLSVPEDDKTVTYYPEGSRLVVDSSGTEERYDEEGILVSRKTFEGEVTYYLPDGAIAMRCHANGEMEFQQPDGSMVRKNGEGTIIALTLPDGTPASLQGDGTWQVTDTEGGVHTYAADGAPLSLVLQDSTLTYFKNGVTRTSFGDGSIRWTAPLGLTVDVAPDGTLAGSDSQGVAMTCAWSDVNHEIIRIQHPDSSYTLLYADGAAERYFPNDVDFLCEPDGRKVIFISNQTEVLLYPDGTISSHDAAENPLPVVQEYDGKIVIYYPDGRVATVMPEGTEYFSSASGCVRKTSPDGFRTFYLPHGITLTQRPDSDPEAMDEEGASLAVTLLENGYYEVEETSGETFTLDPIALSGTFRRNDATRVEVATSGIITVYDAQGRILDKIEPDGKHTQYVYFEGGGMRVHYPDNSREEYDPSGRLILKEDPEGVPTIYNPDGSYTVKYYNGQMDEYSAEGVLLSRRTPEGYLLTYRTDGSTEMKAPSDLAKETFADGSMRWTFPGWKLGILKDSAGTPGDLVVDVAADGNLSANIGGYSVPVEVFGDHGYNVRHPDGSLILLDGDEFTVTRTYGQGIRRSASPSGEILISGFEGRITITPSTDDENPSPALSAEDEEGNPLSAAWEGEGAPLTMEEAVTRTICITRADGSFEKYFPDLSAEFYNAGGVLTSRLFPDNEKIVYDGQGGILSRYLPGGNSIAPGSLGLSYIRNSEGLLDDVVLPGGGPHCQRQSDGSFLGTLVPGLEYVITADGEANLNLPEGGTSSSEGDYIRITFPEGSSLVSLLRLPDGPVVEFTAAGQSPRSITYLPAGGWEISSPGRTDRYDIQGRFYETCDSQGVLTVLDSMGRPAVKEHPGGAIVTFTYSLDGSYVIDDPSLTKTREYYRGPAEGGYLYKKEYEDGTVEEYEAQGRMNRIHRPSGEILEIEYFENGERELTSSAGTIVREAAGGVLLWTARVESDGRKIYFYPDGRVEQYRPAVGGGTLAVRSYPQGGHPLNPAVTVEEFAEDGMTLLELHLADGTVFFFNSDGTYTKDYSWGTLETYQKAQEFDPYHPEGRLIETREAGAERSTTYFYAEDGSLRITYPDESREYFRPPAEGESRGSLSRRDVEEREEGRPLSATRSTYYAEDGVTVTKIVEPDGTTREYRPDGSVSRLYFPSGKIQDFDEQGRVTREVLPSAIGNITVDYCADGRILRTYADETVEEYRADGTLEKRTAPAGSEETFDALGRLAEISYADGTRITLVTDGTRTLILPEGTEYHFDTEDRLVGVTLPGTAPQTYTIIPETGALNLGNPTITNNPDGTVTWAFGGGETETFDSQGRLAEIKLPYPEGGPQGYNTTTFSHASDNARTTTFPDGRTLVENYGETRKFYRADGTLEEIFFSGGYFHYYDPSERLSAGRSQAGLFLTRFLYEGFSLAFPSGEVEIRRADTTMKKRLYPDGKVESYNAREQLTERLYADGRREVYVGGGDVRYYRADGSLEKVTHPGRSFELYDTSGNLIQSFDDNGVSTEHLPDGSTVLTYSDFSTESYSPDGVITARTYPGGISESFDSFGKLISRSYPDGTSVTYTSDGTRALILQNGVHYCFDAEGRLPEVTLPGTTPATYAFNLETGALILSDPAITENPDGTVTWTFAGGEEEVFDSQGKLFFIRLPYPAGGPQGEEVIAFEYLPENIRKTTFSEGRILLESSASREYFRPDGSREECYAAWLEPQMISHETFNPTGGCASRWLSTGSITTFFLNGRESTVSSDEVLCLRRADGTLLRKLYASGEIAQEDFDFQERLSRQILSDGTIKNYTYSSGGGFTINFSTGKIEDYDASSRLLKITNPDGSWETFQYYENGNRRITYSTGEKKVYDAQNQLVHWEEADGSGVFDFTYQAEGVTRTAASGLLCLERTQGSRLFILPDGTTLEVSADGLTAFAEKEGQSAPTEILPDGKIRILNSDGTSTLLNPQEYDLLISAVNGLSLLIMADNVKIWTQPDGVTTRLKTDGTVDCTRDSSQELLPTSILPDGRIAILEKGGTTISINPDFSVTRTSRNGLVQTLRLDGRLEYTFRNDEGAEAPVITATLDPDGTLSESAVRDSQGNILSASLDPDGSLRIVSGSLTHIIKSGLTREVLTQSNLKVEYRADGREIWTQPDGTSTYLKADGSVASFEEAARSGNEGTRTSDGRILATQILAGRIRITNSDGSLIVLNPDYGMDSMTNANHPLFLRINPDNWREFITWNGLVTRLSPDKQTIESFDSGGNPVACHTKPDGKIVLDINPNLTIEIKENNRRLSLEMLTGAGDRFGIMESGSFYGRLKNGSWAYASRQADGGIEIADRLGQPLFKTVVNTDFTQTVTWRGTTKTIRRDGACTFLAANGMHIELDPQNTIMGAVDKDDNPLNAAWEGEGLLRITRLGEEGSVTYLDTLEFTLSTLTTVPTFGISKKVTSRDNYLEEVFIFPDDMRTMIKKYYSGNQKEISTYDSSNRFKSSWLNNDGSFTLSDYFCGLPATFAADLSSITVTANNGVIRKINPDGTILYRHPDGFNVILGSDGTTVQVTDSQGAELSALYQDGLMTFEDSKSYHYTVSDNLEWKIESASGVKVEHFADGQTLCTQPDGTTTRLPANGGTNGSFSRDVAGNALWTSKDSHGSLVIKNTNGTTTLLKSDLTRIILASDGKRLIFSPTNALTAQISFPVRAEIFQEEDGSLLAVDLMGNEYPVLRMPDDSLEIQFSSSMWGIMDAQGNYQLAALNGIFKEIRADGSQMIHLPEGITISLDKTGRLSADGKIYDSAGLLPQRASQDADGTLRFTFRDGRLGVLSPDFTLTTIQHSGATTLETIVHPDSSSTTTQITTIREESNAIYGLSREEVTQTDGSRILRQYDGSVLQKDASGAILSFLTRDNTAPTINEDGSFTALLSDGSVSHYEADFTFIENSKTFADGYTRIIKSDGTLRFELESGNIRVEVRGGAVTAREGDAVLSASKAQDGALTVQSQGKKYVLSMSEIKFYEDVHQNINATSEDLEKTLTWVLFPDGRKSFYNSDGSITHRDASGTLLRIEIPVHLMAASGETQPLLQSDGTWQAVLFDGSISSFDAEGNFVKNTQENPHLTRTFQDGKWWYQNGLSKEVLLDGSFIWTKWEAGDVVFKATIHPDGSFLVEDENGDPISGCGWNKNGRLIVPNQDGTQTRLYFNGLLLTTSGTQVVGVESPYSGSVPLPSVSYDTYVHEFKWTLSLPGYLTLEFNADTSQYWNFADGSHFNIYASGNGSGWKSGGFYYLTGLFGGGWRYNTLPYWNIYPQYYMKVKADPDLSLLYEEANGLTRRVLWDGSSVVLRPSTGLTSGEIPGYLTEYIASNGDVAYTAQNGLTMALCHDHTVSWALADGTSLYLKPDGTISRVTGSYTSAQKLSDGSFLINRASGGAWVTQDIIKPDFTHIIKYRFGLEEERRPDGSVIMRNSQGQVIPYAVPTQEEAPPEPLYSADSLHAAAHQLMDGVSGASHPYIDYIGTYVYNGLASGREDALALCREAIHEAARVKLNYYYTTTSQLAWVESKAKAMVGFCGLAALPDSITPEILRLACYGLMGDLSGATNACKDGIAEKIEEKLRHGRSDYVTLFEDSIREAGEEGASSAHERALLLARYLGLGDLPSGVTAQALHDAARSAMAEVAETTTAFKDAIASGIEKALRCGQNDYISLAEDAIKEAALDILGVTYTTSAQSAWVYEKAREIMRTAGLLPLPGGVTSQDIHDAAWGVMNGVGGASTAYKDYIAFYFESGLRQGRSDYLQLAGDSIHEAARVKLNWYYTTASQLAWVETKATALIANLGLSSQPASPPPLPSGLTSQGIHDSAWNALADVPDATASFKDEIGRLIEEGLRAGRTDSIALAEEAIHRAGAMKLNQLYATSEERAWAAQRASQIIANLGLVSLPEGVTSQGLKDAAYAVMNGESGATAAYKDYIAWYFENGIRRGSTDYLQLAKDSIHESARVKLNYYYTTQSQLNWVSAKAEGLIKNAGLIALPEGVTSDLISRAAWGAMQGESGATTAYKDYIASYFESGLKHGRTDYLQLGKDSIHESARVKLNYYYTTEGQLTWVSNKATLILKSLSLGDLPTGITAQSLHEAASSALAGETEAFREAVALAAERLFRHGRTDSLAVLRDALHVAAKDALSTSYTTASEIAWVEQKANQMFSSLGLIALPEGLTSQSIHDAAWAVMNGVGGATTAYKDYIATCFESGIRHGRSDYLQLGKDSICEAARVKLNYYYTTPSQLAWVATKAGAMITPLGLLSLPANTASAGIKDLAWTVMNGVGGATSAYKDYIAFYFESGIRHGRTDYLQLAKDSIVESARVKLNYYYTTQSQLAWVDAQANLIANRLNYFTQNGKYTLSLSGGATEEHFGSGEVVLHRADGTTKATHPDGSWEDKNASGQITQGRLSDGRTATYAYNPDGSFVRSLSDGSIESHDATGLLLRTDYSGGSYRLYSSDGTSVLHETDGGSKMADAGGFVIRYEKANGDVEQYFHDGTRKVTHADGSWAEYDASGLISRSEYGGITVTYFHYGGGFETRLSSDGTVRKYDASGNLLSETVPERFSVTSMTVKEDGARVISLSDGTKETYRADGNILMKREADGCVSYFFPDGTKLLLASDRVAEEADGSITFQAENGVEVNLGTDGAFIWNGPLTGSLSSSDGCSLSDGRLRFLRGGAVMDIDPMTFTEEVKYQSGLWIKLDAEGNTEYFQPNLTRSLRSASGALSSTDVWGRQAATTLLADGGLEVGTTDGTNTRNTLYANGTILHRNPDGSLITWDENGTFISLSIPGGTMPLRRSDGTYYATLPDGSYSEYASDGSLIQNYITTADGKTRILSGDGTVEYNPYKPTDNIIIQNRNQIHAEIYADRTQVYSNADLRIEITPDGWETWRTARGDIIVLDKNRLVRTDLSYFLGKSFDVYPPQDIRVYSDRIEVEFVAKEKIYLPNLQYDFNAVDVLPRASGFVKPNASIIQTQVQEDGNIIFKHSDGAVTVLKPDYTWETTAANGLTHRKYIDGKEEWVLPNEDWISIDAGGTIQAFSFSEKNRSFPVSRNAEGIIQVIYPNDDVLVVDPRTFCLTRWSLDGTKRVEYSDGRFEVFNAQRCPVTGLQPVVINNLDGSAVSRMADGEITFQLNDGTVPTRNYDGTWTAAYLNGDIVKYTPAGKLSSWFVASKGYTRFYRKDGSLAHIETLSGIKEYFETKGNKVDSYIILPDYSGIRVSRSQGFVNISMPDRRTVYTGYLQPDGSIYLVKADGKIFKIITPDLVVKTLDESGRVASQLLPGGDTEFYHPWGALSYIVAPDGSRGVRQADGSTLYKDAAGNIVRIVLADGTHAALQEDGAYLAVSLDGATTRYRADGSPSLKTYPAGSPIAQVQYAPTGERSENWTDGAVKEFRADGTQSFERCADGTEKEYDLKGRILHVSNHPVEGAIDYLYRVDGTFTATCESGKIEDFRADGTLMRRISSEETITLYDQHGRLISETLSDGATTTFVFHADGTKTGTCTDGSTLSYNAAGTLTRKLLADGSEILYTEEKTATNFISGVVKEEFTSGDIALRWTIPSSLTGSQILLTKSADGIWNYPVTEVTENSASSASLRFSLEDGTFLLLRSDGSADLLDSGFLLLDSLSSAGTLLTYGPGGALISEQAKDGSLKLYQPDGSITAKNASGDIVSITLTDGTPAAWDAQNAYYKAVKADGSVTRFDVQGILFSVLSSDGTLSLYAPDRSLVVTNDDNSMAYYRADGTLRKRVSSDGKTIEEYNASEIITSRKHYDESLATVLSEDHFDSSGVILHTHFLNGDISYVQADGSVRRENSQGVLLSITLSDGTPANLQSDGGYLAIQADETKTYFNTSGIPIRTVNKEGTVTTLYHENGDIVTEDSALHTRITQKADRTRIEENLATGERTTYQVGGDIVTETTIGGVPVTITQKASGSLTTAYGDEALVEEQADRGLLASFMDVQGNVAETIRRDSHGRIFRKVGSGEEEQLSIQGFYSATLTNGVCLKWASDGSITTEYPDGRFEKDEVGGRRTLFVPAESGSSVGETTVWHVYGAVEVTHADGSKLFTHTDGTTVATDANGAITVTPASEDTIYTETGDVKVENVGQTFRSASTCKTDGSVEEESFELINNVWQRTSFTAYAPTGTITSQEFELEDPAKVTTTIQQYNGTVIVQNPDGSGTETRFDGTYIQIESDGTRFTLMSDGKTRLTELTDGSSIRRNADGSLTVQAVENSTLLVQEASGDWQTLRPADVTITWKNDGSGRIMTRRPEEGQTAKFCTVTENLDGTIVTEKSDGSIMTSYPSGATITRYQDGRVLVSQVSGASFLLDPAGKFTFGRADNSEETIYTSGLREVRYLDGSITTFYLSGVKVTKAADKSLTVEAPDASKLTKSLSGNLTLEINPESQYISRAAQGDYLVKTDDGQFIHIYGKEPGGEQTSVYGNAEETNDGTRFEFKDDGTIIKYSGDTITRWEADGSVTELKGSGKIYWEASTGRVLYYENDKLRLVVEPDNTETEYLPDGQYITRVPEAGEITEKSIEALGQGYWDSLVGTVSCNGRRKIVIEDGSQVCYMKGENTITRIPYRTILINGQHPSVQWKDNWASARIRPWTMAPVKYYTMTSEGPKLLIPKESLKQLADAYKAGYKFVVAYIANNHFVPLYAANNIIEEDCWVRAQEGMVLTPPGPEWAFNYWHTDKSGYKVNPDGSMAVFTGIWRGMSQGVSMNTYTLPPLGDRGDGTNGVVNPTTGEANKPDQKRYKITYENCSCHLGEPGYEDMVPGEGIRTINSKSQPTDIHRCADDCHWIFTVKDQNGYEIKYHSDIRPIVEYQDPQYPPGNAPPKLKQELLLKSISFNTMRIPLDPDIIDQISRKSNKLLLHGDAEGIRWFGAELGKRLALCEKDLDRARYVFSLIEKLDILKTAYTSKHYSDLNEVRSMKKPYDPYWTLATNKRGGCGEWAYVLQHLFTEAGIERNNVRMIWATMIPFPLLEGINNHAGVVVKDSKGREFVFDVWKYGKNNNGELKGLGNSAYNAMPIEQWKAQERREGKLFFKYE
ncbi:MAG: hypothetical protein V2A78_14035 [bacterium]